MSYFVVSFKNSVLKRNNLQIHTYNSQFTHETTNLQQALSKRHQFNFNKLCLSTFPSLIFITLFTFTQAIHKQEKVYFSYF